MKRIVSSILVVVMLGCSLFATAGCINRVQAIECTKDIEPRAVEEVSDYTKGNRAATDFAVELFKASSTKGKNSLVSPLSVMCALAMTANGADGQTLKEMENVLGMPMDELNTYLRSYVKNLPQGNKYKFSVANSIWINENSGLVPSQDFLQTNVDYYDAMIYKAPFDNQIVKDINNWTSQNTDKMIKKIVESVSPHQVMYLINAVAMDAEWQKVYESNDVRKGTFTLEDGTEKYVDFMYATESQYLSDDYAKGFVKYYKERKYAYVALLPDEDITVDEYVEKLSGEHISKLLADAQSTTVKTSIPKYKTEYSLDMVNVLRNMGIKDAFKGDKANFSKMGESANGNVYIDEVKHKTYIEVYEKGTKAAAITMVGMKDGAAMPEEIKEVYLNRPFVYMIIDCEHSIPVFMGTMHDVTVTSVTGEVDTKVGDSDEAIGEPVDETEEIEYSARRVRIGWKESFTGGVILIESRKALEKVIEADGSSLEEYAKYDDKFFEKNVLAVTVVSENSGSIGHEVTGVEMLSDGLATISIKRTVPEAGTCDMASWRILVELDKDCGVSAGKVMVWME